MNLTVNPVNDAPTAVGRMARSSTSEDVAVTLTAAQLVGNDTDPEGGALSVDSVGGAVNGSVVLNGDGSVTFTPTANASGPASFTYKVKDAADLASTNSATVNLTVNPVNDAPTAVGPDGPFLTTEDVTVTLTAAQLVGNDTDVEAGALAVDSVGGATNGVVSLNPNGSVTFTPTANYSGPASFTYKVKDAAGLASANTATVNLTVNPVNDAPTAVGPDGPFATNEDTAVTLSAGQLVGNDTDVEPGVLSVDSVDGAVNGSVVLNGDGTVTFTPTANYAGPASFIYRVKDAGGTSSANIATVNITVNAVNDAPTAVGGDGPFVTNEDTAVTIGAAALVGNDTDVDGGALSVDSVGGAVNGAVVLNGDGSVTFTPTVNASGPASFTYKVKDAAGLASVNSATVNVTVNAVNDAPTAVGGDGPFVTNEDVAVTIGAAALVGNDTDVEAGALSVNSVGGAVNGSVVLNGDGTVTFTPAANYSGAASFTYKVKDAAGLASVNSATVNLTVNAVNDAPTAVGPDGPFSTNEDAAVTLTAAQLVGNDTDLEASALSVDSVGGAVNGSVVLNGDGTVTFTPTANYSGAASFTYKVKDAAGLASTNTATVNITVNPINDPPTAVGPDGPFSTNEDTALTIAAAQLVGNDTDPDVGQALSVASVAGAVNGTVLLNSNGTVRFTPTSNYSGPASFTYKVKDAAGVESANSVTVNLTINSVNDLPTASTTYTNFANGVSNGSITAGDIEGDPLTFQVTAQGASGTAAINPATRTFTYTPTAAARNAAAATQGTDTDTFTFTVDDGNGGTITRNVTVEIMPAGVVSDVSTVSADNVFVSPDRTKFVTSVSTFNSATGQSTTKFTVVDAATGAQIGTPITLDGGSATAKYTPNGTGVVIAASSANSQVALVSLADGTIRNGAVATVSGAVGSSDIEFLENGATVLVRNPITVSGAPATAFGLLTPTTTSAFTVVGESFLTPLVFSPDRSRAVLTTSVDNNSNTRVTIVNTATGAIIGTPTQLSGLAYNPPIVTADRAFVATSAFLPSSGTLAIFNTGTGALVGSPVTLVGDTAGLALSPDGSRVALAIKDEDSPGPIRTRVILLNTSTGAVISGAPIDLVGFTRGALVFSTDGSRLFQVTEGTNQPVLYVINSSNGALIASHTLNGWEAESGLMVSADRTRGYIPIEAFSGPSGNNGTQLIQVNMTTGQPTATGPSVDGDPEGAAFSPDGSRFVVFSRNNVGGMTGRVSVYNASTGALINSVVVFSGPETVDSWIDNLEFTTDNRVIVTHTAFSPIKVGRMAVVDLSNGTVIGPAYSANEHLRVTLGPNGVGAIVTVDNSLETIVINTGTGKQTILTRPNNNSNNMLISPDGSRVMFRSSVSDSATQTFTTQVQVVNTATGVITTTTIRAPRPAEVYFSGNSPQASVLSANSVRIYSLNG